MSSKRRTSRKVSANAGSSSASSGAATATTSASGSTTTAPVKRRRVFGGMTKRVWMSVWVFLMGWLYVFTLGSDLSNNHFQNVHWTRSHIFDRSTAFVEGDIALAESVFGSSYFIPRFLNQVASHFTKPHSPTAVATDLLSLPHTGQFMFVDSATGELFSNDLSWTISGIVKLENENLSGLDKVPTSNRAGRIIGPGGMAARPGTGGRQLYVAQPAKQRIVLYDTETKQSTEVVSQYQGQQLNGPWGLRITQDYGLCFTDQSLYGLSASERRKLGKQQGSFAASGVYCMPLSKNTLGVDVSSMRLLAEVEVDRGQPLDFLVFPPNSDGNVEEKSARLVIAQCKESRMNLAKFVADSKGFFGEERVQYITEDMLDPETFPKAKFSAADSLPGCSSSLAPSGHDSSTFLALMPGSRLGFLDINDGSVKFVIKGYDKAVFDDMNWVGSRLILTANSTVWYMQRAQSEATAYHQFIQQ